jgi:hypothetical protein
MKTLLINSALLALALSLSAIGGPVSTPALAADTPAPAATPTIDVDPAL